MDRIRASKEIHTLLRDGYRAEWRTMRASRPSPPSATSTSAIRATTTGSRLHRCGSPEIFIAAGPTRFSSSTASRLVLAEFKEPNRPVKAAYDENLTDYYDTIPQLFWPNGFVILSNGSEAKVGATYAPWGFFGDWKIIDVDGNRGVVALETAIRGTCAHDRLLDLIENFVAYMERPGGW